MLLWIFIRYSLFRRSLRGSLQYVYGLQLASSRCTRGVNSFFAHKSVHIIVMRNWKRFVYCLMTQACVIIQRFVIVCRLFECKISQFHISININIHEFHVLPIRPHEHKGYIYFLLPYILHESFVSLLHW